MTHTVKFIKEGETWTVEVADGATLLEAARACEAPVHTLCHGIAACIQCKVRVVSGATAISAPEAIEKDRIGNLFHITGERLACQTKVHGEVVVEALDVRLPNKRRQLSRPPR